MMTTIEMSLPSTTSQLSAQYVDDARPEVAAHRFSSIGDGGSSAPNMV